MSEFTSNGPPSDQHAMFERLPSNPLRSEACRCRCSDPSSPRSDCFEDWPLILIDLHTEEGVVGRSYLEPYLKQSPRSIVPVIHDLVASDAGKPLAPLASFQANRRSLNLIGYEGITMIAVSGLDMAIWDALAKAAGMPLAVLLGGRGQRAGLQQQRPMADRRGEISKRSKELVAEGQFKGLKLRLGRDRLADDLAAIREVRDGAGDEIC